MGFLNDPWCKLYLATRWDEKLKGKQLWHCLRDTNVPLPKRFTGPLYCCSSPQIPCLCIPDNGLQHNFRITCNFEKQLCGCSNAHLLQDLLKFAGWMKGRTLMAWIIIALLLCACVFIMLLTVTIVFEQRRISGELLLNCLVWDSFGWKAVLFTSSEESGARMFNEKALKERLLQGMISSFVGITQTEDEEDSYSFCERGNGEHRSSYWW